MRVTINAQVILIAPFLVLDQIRIRRGSIDNYCRTGMYCGEPGTPTNLNSTLSRMYALYSIARYGVCQSLVLVHMVTDISSCNIIVIDVHIGK